MIRKNRQKFTNFVAMVALLSMGVGCTNESPDQGTPTYEGCGEFGRGEGPSVPDPVTLELPTEVVYLPGERDRVFSMSTFEDEVFWLETVEEGPSPYRLMGVSVGADQQPTKRLDVASEMFEGTSYYVASSDLVVMSDGGETITTRLSSGERTTIRTENDGSVYGLYSSGFVQDERYVYVQYSQYVGFDQILRLDKQTLETEVFVDGQESASNLTLVGDVLYFVAMGGNCDTGELILEDQIFQVDLNTGDLTAVTSNNLGVSGPLVPLGDSLFYLGERNDSSRPLMKVSLADGSVSRMADVHRNAYYLQTDGKRFFYEDDFGDYGSRLYSLLPDGSEFSVIAGSNPLYGFIVSDGYLYEATDPEIRRYTLP